MTRGVHGAALVCAGATMQRQDENRLRDSSAAWRRVPRNRTQKKTAAISVGMTAGCCVRERCKAQNGFNGRANLRQTVAFDSTRERRERKRKPAERFFTARRRVPRNGMRGKTGRHFVSANDAGLQNAAMSCVTVRWAGVRGARLGSSRRGRAGSGWGGECGLRSGDRAWRDRCRWGDSRWCTGGGLLR